MSSSDALPIPRKNTAYRITFPIFDADGDLVTGATGLDSEVSKDGGTFADCTNEATEIATSSGMYYLDLTSTEMNADTVAIIIKTSSSGAKTTPIVLYPEETGDIRCNVTQISDDTTAADNCELMFDGTGYAGGTTRLKIDGTIRKNTALTAFPFFMVDSSDDISGKTGLTVTATRSIDGAAFASCANAVSEISNGLYKINLAAADLNGDTIILKFTATGANPTIIPIITAP